VKNCAQDRGQSFFPIRTDLGRQIKCLFFSVANYFISNIFVDFLLKQFHTVRVRLTDKQCFLRLDNKILFAMIVVII